MSRQLTRTEQTHPVEVRYRPLMAETADDTDDEGTFSFALSTDIAGGTQVTAWADQDGDDQFCAELYRALTNRTLSKADHSDGHLVLSWNRAADFVNELRAQERHGPLPLAASGGEGVVSEVMLDELAARGWRTRPLSSG